MKIKLKDIEIRYLIDFYVLSANLFKEKGNTVKEQAMMKRAQTFIKLLIESR